MEVTFVDDTPAHQRTTGMLIQALFALRKKENVLLIVSNNIEAENCMRWLLEQFGNTQNPPSGRLGFPCSFQHGVHFIKTNWSTLKIVTVQDVALSNHYLRGVDWKHCLIDHHAMELISRRWLANHL